MKSCLYIILSDWFKKDSSHNLSVVYVNPLKVNPKHSSLPFIEQYDLTEITDIHKFKVDKTIAVIPGELINNYRLEIPIKKKKHLNNAILFGLEDEIAEKVSDIHWVVSEWQPGKFADVMSVNKNKFESTIAIFKELNIDLDDIVPDYQLLPMHPSTTHTISALDDERYLIFDKQRNDGFALDKEMFEIWWEQNSSDSNVFAVNSEELAQELVDSGNNNVNFWDIGKTPRDWLEHVNHIKMNAVPVFMQGNYENKNKDMNSSLLIKAASIVVIGVLLHACILGGSYFWHQMQTNDIKQNFVAEFNETFGESAFKQSIDNELQIRQQIAQLKGKPEKQSIFFTLMTSLSPVVGEHGQQLSRLDFNGAELLAETSVGSFDELNQVVNSFKENNKNTSIEITESESSSNQTVTGTYKISLNNEG